MLSNSKALLFQLIFLGTIFGFIGKPKSALGEIEPQNPVDNQKPQSKKANLSFTGIEKVRESLLQQIYPLVDKPTEKVRVIVTFTPLREPFPASLKQQDIENLRKDNKLRIDEVLQTLDPATVEVIHRYDVWGGFNAKLTFHAIKISAANPTILAIEGDIDMFPHRTEGRALMKVDSLQASGIIGSGQTIAIIDTGVDYCHNELGGPGTSPCTFPNAKVIGGTDVADNDADPYPDCANGGEDAAHGTAVAGIAAGSNGGIAPDARIVAIKISPASSGNCSSPPGNIAAAINWAIANRTNVSPPISIINISFGGGVYSSACDSSENCLATAATNADAAGIIIFASSGNDGVCNGMGAPACVSNIISVGAVYDANIGSRNWCVNPNGATCQKDNNTPSADCEANEFQCPDGSTEADRITCYSNEADPTFLDILAPSHDATTTDIVGPGGSSPGDIFTGFGGTSAASPYAAGVAALISSEVSDLNTSTMRSLLTSTGDLVSSIAVSDRTIPRVNASRALMLVNPLLSASVGIHMGDPQPPPDIEVRPLDSEQVGIRVEDSVPEVGPEVTPQLASSVGVTVTCDDINPCTDDQFDADEGCVNSWNTATCSDGDACTIGDICSDGACFAGSPETCPSGPPGSVSCCEPSIGCLIAENGPEDITVGLDAAQRTVISWLSLPGSSAYNVYRGVIFPPNINNPDGFQYNHCTLALGTPQTQIIDRLSPQPGAAFYYFVTAIGCGQEFPLGFDSFGNPRPGPGPCVDSDFDTLPDSLDPDPLCQNVSGSPDADGDGFVEVCECNDEDSFIFPGASERCNGVDDDCDREVDELPVVDLGDPCSSVLPGVCQPGLLACDSGVLTCTPISAPQPETCNLKDDDCDGFVDEDGVCAPGAGTISIAGLAAPKVGVHVPQDVSSPETVVTPLEGQPVGVAVGSSLTAIIPSTGLRGTSNLWITFYGSGLETINDVTFFPSDGIAITGLPIGGSDGLSATIIISISTDAPLGTRLVIVEVDTGTVPPATIEANVFDVIDK